jgi:TRAP-type C4-dicarboxylate transport system permease small subunit
MMAPMPTVIKIIHRLEDSVLVAMVLAMIGIAISQIWLRNFHDSGISWADNALRVMVLWLAMFGAMIATRERNHIAIDVLKIYASKRGKRVLAMFASASTAVICFTGAWYSGEFVLLEYQYSYNAFASVPAWLCEVIIPLGLAVIGWRFTLQCVMAMLWWDKLEVAQ